MKSLIFAVAAASALSLPLASFAQVQSNQPLTRAQVKADLVRVEQAGYSPAVGTDPYYPADIQAAEARVAQQQGAPVAENTGVGGAVNGSVQSGAPVNSRPTNADGVHPLFFGR
ncbi:hypothetical protein C9I57_25250 [Trinickia symbiotica]|uniref:DUF4148 domain-containing protein n=1 Tax=Trinickia symbiotica TaxID=863227 RepID=A0A2T3XMU0_9BURK|nr:DUF4148 domain-containing protein [Trinickia symbiotica]PTB17839.1 hypothetical protein C9I57_25250 [Trinickia symbiotica]